MDVQPTAISIAAFYERGLPESVWDGLRAEFGALYEETGIDGRSLNSEEHHAMARVDDSRWLVMIGPNSLGDDTLVDRYLNRVLKYLAGACQSYGPLTHSWWVLGTSSESAPEPVTFLRQLGDPVGASVKVSWRWEADGHEISFTLGPEDSALACQLDVDGRGGPSVPAPVSELVARLRDSCERYLRGVIQ